METNRATHLTWENRERDLRQVKRYGGFSVMFYRTNLWIHSQRVVLLLESLLPLTKTYPDFDVKKARLIATHHDDYELQPIGDVPLQLKLKMNEGELSSLKQEEILSAEAMARAYPKRIGRYSYLQLLLHSIFKDCVEAQLVSVVDKVDGYCEALHEVLAGNTVFLEPVINYNTRTFDCLVRRFPLIEKMFSSGHNLLSVPVINLSEYFESGERGAQPHTTGTIARKTGIPMYEEWKKTTIKNMGVGALIDQNEFHERQLD